MSDVAVGGKSVTARVPLCVKERDGDWHIISPLRTFVPGDWAPIACSDTDGIVLPGTPERREPTCQVCRRKVGLL